MVALWSFNINIFQKKNYFFVVSLSNIILPPISCARAQSSRDSWQTITKIYPKIHIRLSRKLKMGELAPFFESPKIRDHRPITENIFSYFDFKDLVTLPNKKTGCELINQHWQWNFERFEFLVEEMDQEWPHFKWQGRMEKNH